MRRAISALVALALAILSALMVRWTNGVPVIMGLFLVLCPVVCVSDEPEPYPSAGIVRIIGRGNQGGQAFGHGCPVSPTALLTAGHVTERGQVTWDDMSGNDGRAEFLRRDSSRDLAVLFVKSGRVGVTFAIAKKAPAVGERVYVVGYNDAPNNPLRPTVEAAKVVGVMAGHVFYKRSPGPGSSGSCILNEHREVVGVNSSYHEITGAGYRCRDVGRLDAAFGG